LFAQASCVAIDGAAVLLRGGSGSGKSDLALRLIDRGARLIADDGIELRRAGNHVIASLPASAPDSVRGRLEVRGLGIMPVPSSEEAPLVLVIDLVPNAAIDRLPAPATVDLLGIAVPFLRLAGLEASAPAKVRLAVRAAAQSIMRSL
jgi:serine kinase of HPr protein (carbohydrate metabolism regulator)